MDDLGPLFSYDASSKYDVLSTRQQMKVKDVNLLQYQDDNIYKQNKLRYKMCFGNKFVNLWIVSSDYLLKDCNSYWSRWGSDIRVHFIICTLIMYLDLYYLIYSSSLDMHFMHIFHSIFDISQISISLNIVIILAIPYLIKNIRAKLSLECVRHAYANITSEHETIFTYFK